MVPPRLTLVSDNTREKKETPASGASPETRADAPPAALSDPEKVDAPEVQSRNREKLRRLEAMLFAASEPLDVKALMRGLDGDDDVNALLTELQAEYRDRGVNLVRVAGRWQFRTADDLSFLLERQQKDERKLSKAALETLAIVAYHQPVTRAEIEEIRGVSTSPGTLDVLMETGWIRPRGRRRAPGRPLTYGTTEEFLVHFGMDSIKDLPGLADLKASGLLDANLPPGFTVPSPTDVAALMPDELPLTDDGDEEEEQEELALDEADEPEADDETAAEAPDDGEK
ncbi:MULTISPECIES: SMC-Scp complex subunit ScpB [unclassified Hyphomicrobium]|uniref:SMC-Scp complex subunit ScpB n=1 Tax=unclassified Hyphomicrobium TaxID=2619925 RepID=UPI000213E414|nr:MULTISPECIES: SMC-Scp complex subunit ScpB [unclassified Hyphomicrobium]CCB65906.1 Chromosome segregation and condensation protein, ScpB [Hyphomicrobium sp. MC1]